MNYRCRHPLRASLLLLTLLAAGDAATARAQMPDDNSGPATTSDVTRPPSLSNDSILRMTKAGLEDALIISTIRTQPGHYDLSADQVIGLRQAGVSAPVIEAMQARDAGLHQHTASEVATAHAERPVSLPEGVDEIGVYYRDKAGQWQILPVERVYFKSSGWLKNALSDGLIKQDMNGHLDGQHAKLMLHPGEEFLIYTPAGTQGEEYDLLRLQEHGSSRDFRTLTGGLFHSESGTQRNAISVTPKRLSARLYSFTMPVDIELGEYGVLPPGTANQQGIGGTGKIFTFALTSGEPLSPANQTKAGAGH